LIQGFHKRDNLKEVRHYEKLSANFEFTK